MPQRHTIADGSPEPASTFLADARAVIAEKYRLQNRMAALEAALAECLHHMAVVHGIPTDEPEPACAIRAKQLLGWKLG